MPMMIEIFTRADDVMISRAKRRLQTLKNQSKDEAFRMLGNNLNSFRYDRKKSYSNIYYSIFSCFLISTICFFMLIFSVFFDFKFSLFYAILICFICLLPILIAFFHTFRWALAQTKLRSAFSVTANA